ARPPNVGGTSVTSCFRFLDIDEVTFSPLDDPVNLPDPWPVPNEMPALAEGAVHVWRMRLDLAPAQIANLRRVLTGDERVRADRFHAERHRQRFIACRAQVRQLLAGYLKERPERIDFSYGPQGKPAL